MTDPHSFAWLHDAVTWLLTPALAALLLACAIALIEAGLAAEATWRASRPSPATGWSAPTCSPASRRCSA